VSEFKKDFWKHKLGNKTKPRIGIVWSGSMTNRIDHNPFARRNIPLAQMNPLFDLPFEFHVLQKEFRSEDQSVLAGLNHLHLHHDDLIDFSDTAALIEEMDLVISVCTSVAHLSGALGHPTWVLLPYSADYRWLVDRNDSPWYPTVALFRTQNVGDWSSVISNIIAQLKVKFAN
jgi:hypothetical protein